METSLCVLLIGPADWAGSIPRVYRSGAHIQINTRDGVPLAVGETDDAGTVTLTLNWPFELIDVGEVQVDGIYSAWLPLNGDIFALDLINNE